MRRDGCLEGLLKLFLLNVLFDWLQDNVGFGRGGCSGCGCGVILLLIFMTMACCTIVQTDWLSLF